ncbi:Chromatin structure-remodeling complex protein rsc9 [Podospora pseudoanserina]|uniref:Chromatin structure-remodeling complex protein rsc9 n=1 Tax=Podospora pseudoanserina TaxID=2609844 RepID=A0ABR0IAQ3_9PEZI|nr:Chromatin structure-remodeling complex protein rsc9 [Podospora pseudoanserina]
MAPTKPIVEHTVDRTPEYEKFLEELRDFHEKRGTHLDPEPKMGNLSVDLYKLFNYIVQNGGYDKVSDEKLMWRKMCEGLGLMRHNAPADAYTLKQIFYKNLAAFEIKKIHNKEPPPPEILEFTTAKGGSLLTRTLENFVAKGRNDREDSEDGSTPGRERPVAETPASGRASRGLREAPAPRVIFHPDTNSSRQTRHASGAQQIGTPSSNSHSHNNSAIAQNPGNSHRGAYVFNPPGPDMNNPIVQGFVPQPVQQMPLRIVDTPSSNPELFARKQRLLKQPPVAAPNPGMLVRACLPPGALDGPNIYERCLLSLRSGIRSEQAFGCHHLLKISHERGDKYKFSQFCGLAEGLTELALSIGGMIYHVNWTVSYDPDSDNTDIGELDGLEGTPDILERIAQLKRRKDVDDNILPAEFRDQLTLVLEATQTIRNMVNMPDNAYFMSEYPPVKDLLCVILNLPELECVVELKHLALEIAESILPYLVLRSDDPLYQSLLAKLESDDRGVILTALKALNKIALNHPIETNRLGNVPPSVLQRIMDWLLLNDEDLLDITTDFLYQYTAVVENLDTMLKYIKIEHLVTHLVRLLSHGAKRSMRELIVSEARLAYDPPNETVVPTPKDLLEKLLAIEEPERCYAWIRCFFEEDPDSNITQLAIWQAYNTEFLEPLKRKGRSMISAPEFIKSITSVYESAGAQIVHEQGPGGQSQQKYLIRGIRPRRYPISPDGRGYFQCQLPAPHGKPPGGAKCGAWNLTAEKMWDHIVAEHLGDSVSRTEDGKLVNKEGMFSCAWNNCQKFPRPTEMFLVQYMAHLKTHLRSEEIRHAAKPSEISPLAPLPPPPPSPTSTTNRSRSGSFSSSSSKSRVVRPAKTVTITIEETASARDERNPNAPAQAAGVPLSAVLILRNIAQYVPRTEAEAELRRRKNEGEEGEGWNEILFRPVMGRLWEVFTENRLLTPHLAGLFGLLEERQQVRRFVVEE